MIITENQIVVAAGIGMTEPLMISGAHCRLDGDDSADTSCHAYAGTMPSRIASKSRRRIIITRRHLATYASIDEIMPMTGENEPRGHRANGLQRRARPSTALMLIVRFAILFGAGA